jgi:hypothetical protein
METALLLMIGGVLLMFALAIMYSKMLADHFKSNHCDVCKKELSEIIDKNTLLKQKQEESRKTK